MRTRGRNNITSMGAGRDNGRRFVRARTPCVPDGSRKKTATGRKSRGSSGRNINYKYDCRAPEYFYFNYRRCRPDIRFNTSENEIREIRARPENIFFFSRKRFSETFEK